MRLLLKQLVVCLHPLGDNQHECCLPRCRIR
jgi:hypothetical protein